MVSTGNDFLLQTLYVVTQENIKLKSKFKLWIFFCVGRYYFQ